MSEVAALVRQEKTLPEVQAAVTLDGFRARFVTGRDPTPPAVWTQSIRAGLVERAFRCVTGSRC